jgi:peptidoglycan hydrolase CwlO-like protein
MTFQPNLKLKLSAAAQFVYLGMTLVCLAGCMEESTDFQSSSSDSEYLTLRRENNRFRREIEKLLSENRVLNDKVTELSIRAEKLDKNVADMRFEMEQLREQVKALADVPAERDRYKAEADKSKRELIKLQMEHQAIKDRQGGGN